MKKALLLALFFCHFNLLSAQIFFKQDSANKKSIFQIELGGYYGVHYIKPITPGFTYEVENGTDVGVMANVITNVTPTLSIGLSFRSVTQTAMIGIANEAFKESFFLIMPGYQKIVSLNYQLSSHKKEILTFGVGIGKLKGTYYTSHGLYDNILGGPQTSQGDRLINNMPFEFKMIKLEFKKRLIISDNISITPFFETEFFTSPLVKFNYSNIQGVYTQYFSEFKLTNTRVGLCLTFF